MARVTLIHYLCRHPDHQTLADDAARDPAANPITLNGKEWAFCPSGARSGHDWERIDGLSADDLRDRLRSGQRI